MEIVPSSDVFPTLINDDGKSSNVSAVLAVSDRCSNGRLVTRFALLTPPFATPTLLLDCRRIGSRARCLSFSLM